MSKLRRIEGKFIELDEIEKIYKIENYSELCNLVKGLIEDNVISPVKNSGGNGKIPTLFKRYRIMDDVVDNSDLIDEITYKFSTRFSVEFYKKHVDKYKEHRKYILKLNDFFISKSQLLNTRVSMNERAFQIWGREKFLQKEGGKTILKNLGIELEELNYYDTSEPLAYYSKSKKTPQKVLILENKDTYYTLRRHLISGSEKILNEDIGTLIYGGGKNINKAFNDFNISVEDYVCSCNNTILYFGDLDYEGIVIYEGLYKLFKDEYNIKPFVKGYEKIIYKAELEEVDLPTTKEGQNRNISDIFLNEFNEKYRKKIEKILEDNLYIPQEMLNISDL